MSTGSDPRETALPPSDSGASSGPAPAAPPTPAGGTPGTVDLRDDEVSRLKAERDAAVAALDRQGRRDRRRTRLRRIVAGVLVAVFAVLLPLTTVVGWAHNVVLNNDGWVRTVGPLASDPAVTAAVSREVTDQAFTALNAQSEIAGALPPKAAFLAAPITNGVKGYVQTAVNNALSTKQFQTLWVDANRFAHQQLVKVLEGHSSALTTTNGQVVLNLVPLLNAALQQVEPFVSGVVGRPVNLPTISADQVPADACAKISSALGRPLPQNCGQVPLFPADKLDQAQRIVRAFNRVTILLLVLTPVAAGLALWVSKRRRRTLLQLTVGGLLGLVVARRTLWWLEDSLIRSGKPENKAARQAIVSQVTHGFFTLSGWFMFGLAVIFLAALLTGPYAWARATRRYVVQGATAVRELAVATVGRARDERTAGWITDHLAAMQVGGVLVAILVMIIASVSFIGFLVIAVLLAAYELWLRQLSANFRHSAGGPGTGPGAPASGPVSGSQAKPRS